MSLSFFGRVFISIIFIVLTILCYYVLFPFHGESSSLTFAYIGIIAFLYACYKAIVTFLGGTYITFTPLSIFFFFLLHLLILCLLFFVSTKVPGIYGIYLFFRIVIYFGICSLIFLLSMSFGESVLKRLISSFSQQDIYFRMIGSFILGFSTFLFSLSLLAVTSLYSLVNIGIILVIFFIIGWEEFLKIGKKIFTHKIQLENHDFSSEKLEKQLQPYLLSTEFFFIIITLLLSVNFINVIRPFPIGWDDLGVYMNFPKLLAQASGNISVGKMYLWELFTGIGFLSGYQSLAFFLNSFSGVLSLGVIVLGYKSMFSKEKGDINILNIPLLLATIFLCMPMVVFQIAKDMKLDVGLFSLSFAVLVFLLALIQRIKNISQKDIVLYFLLIGIGLGITFAIKVTSLLLLSGIIALISYYYLGVFGLLGYIGLYISCFTLGNLWSLMNIVFPYDSSTLVYGVSSVFGVLGIGFLAFSVAKQNQYNFIPFIKVLGVIFLGFIVALLPWVGKNIGELDSFSLSGLIGGKGDRYILDYSQIYSSEELKTIKEREYLEVNSNGIVENEDFGRYFGYEQGVNNYLKLPWNLTMQVNQEGEFTDITYIYFCLIPLLFLFLPYRKQWHIYPVIGVIFLEMLYFFPIGISQVITSFFSKVTLPSGYILFLLIAICSFLYFYVTLDKKKKYIGIFLSLFAFIIVYYLLWSVSAFGVVWYGIVMYGAFLLLISICLLSWFRENENIYARNTPIYLVFGVVFFYIVQSSIPHTLTNLQRSSYIEYKTGQISESRALFEYHPDYFDILFSLNIKEEKKPEFIEIYKQQLYSAAQESNIIPTVQAQILNLETIQELYVMLYSFSQIDDSNGEEKLKQFKKASRNIQENMYHNIISPQREFFSEAPVYRVGTFLKYFIIENNKRIIEDSLLNTFDTYIFADTDEETILRLKKLGVGYLLIDLNAATIDNDPRKDLTRRYENLIKLVSSDTVEVIETDSLCLQYALVDYKDNGNIDHFMKYVTVNHASRGQTMQEKLLDCKARITEILINEKEDIPTKYPFLQQIQNYVIKNKGDINNINHIAYAVDLVVNQGFKILLKIN